MQIIRKYQLMWMQIYFIGAYVHGGSIYAVIKNKLSYESIIRRLRIIPLHYRYMIYYYV